MVNTNKLKGAIVSAGISRASIAAELGISKNTLSAKLNGTARITTDEAKTLCAILGITEDRQKCEIFLI